MTDRVMSGIDRWLLCLLLLWLLTACAPKRQQMAAQRDKPAMPLRELAAHGPWRLEGKLALSDGRNSGSGRFEWFKDAGLSTVSMTAPLGQGYWQLEERPDEVTLRSSRNGVFSGQSAAALLAQEVGWDVPWDALPYWLFGLPWQEDASFVALARSEGGRLWEMGWKIEYSRFKHTPAGLLPHKLVAHRPPYTIKLIVRQWRFPESMRHVP